MKQMPVAAAAFSAQAVIPRSANEGAALPPRANSARLKLQTPKSGEILKIIQCIRAAGGDPHELLATSKYYRIFIRWNLDSSSHTARDIQNELARHFNDAES